MGLEQSRTKSESRTIKLASNGDVGIVKNITGTDISEYLWQHLQNHKGLVIPQSFMDTEHLVSLCIFFVFLQNPYSGNSKGTDDEQMLQISSKLLSLSLAKLKNDKILKALLCILP